MKVLSGGAVKTFLDVSAHHQRTATASKGCSRSRSRPTTRPAASPTSSSPERGGALQVYEHRRSADPDVADPATRRLVISIPHTEAANHNGGQLQFGPDGLLYIGTGDGGSANDTPNSDAEVTTSLLGKILRIDPRGATPGAHTVPADNPFGNAVWSYGLRNPWRFSFDRSTGDLAIADVGQGAPRGDRLRDRRVRPRRAASTTAGAAARARSGPPRAPRTGGLDAALLGRRAAGEPDVPGHRLQPRAATASARSPAATSSATPGCRRSPAATSTATSATAQLRSLVLARPVDGRRAAASPVDEPDARSARTPAGGSTSSRARGPVYRVEDGAGDAVRPVARAARPAAPRPQPGTAADTRKPSRARAGAPGGARSCSGGGCGSR